jgi:hypothetical protein
MKTGLQMVTDALGASVRRLRGNAIYVSIMCAKMRDGKESSTNF